MEKRRSLGFHHTIREMQSPDNYRSIACYRRDLSGYMVRYGTGGVQHQNATKPKLFSFSKWAWTLSWDPEPPSIHQYKQESMRLAMRHHSLPSTSALSHVYPIPHYFSSTISHKKLIHNVKKYFPKAKVSPERSRYPTRTLNTIWRTNESKKMLPKNKRNLKSKSQYNHHLRTSPLWWDRQNPILWTGKKTCLPEPESRHHLPLPKPTNLFQKPLPRYAHRKRESTFLK